MLEFLLINHPLDCPVCDKGGECPLQDQTMSYGPGESRFVEEKRHFEKPIPISDLVALDRERCILCDRCTRFAKRGGRRPAHPLPWTAATRPQVNTFPDHPFASYFSGNTVQICPVGALTATPYRFKARPWDLDQVESHLHDLLGRLPHRRCSRAATRSCATRASTSTRSTGAGCATRAASASRRSTATTASARPLVRERRRARRRRRGATRCSDGRRRHPRRPRPRGPGVAVLGGARLTNEDAYAWAKLAKGVIGTDNVDAQLGDGLPAEVVLGLPRATIDEACAPGRHRAAARPRPQGGAAGPLPAAPPRGRQRRRRPSSSCAPQRTGVRARRRHRCCTGPARPARSSRALLGRRRRPARSAASSPTRSAAAARLLADGPVTVVLGRPSVAESADGVVAAAAAIHAAHPEVRFLSRPAPRQRARRPRHGPGARAPARAGSRSATAGDVVRRRRVAGVPAEPGPRRHRHPRRPPPPGKIDVLVLLGADPLADFPDRDLAARGLAGARTVIAVDLFLTASAEQADVVLAAAGLRRGRRHAPPTSRAGSARVAQKITPPGTARADWMIAAELARLLGADLGLESQAQILDGDRRGRAGHAGLTPGARRRRPRRRRRRRPPTPCRRPPSEAVESAAVRPPRPTGPRRRGRRPPSRRPARLREPLARPTARPAPAAVAAPVDAYSLRLVATRKLYDLGTDVQHSPSLAGLAPGTAVRLHPHDFDRLGVEAGTDGRRSPSARGLAGTLPVAPRRRRAPRARPPCSSTSPARDVGVARSTPPQPVTDVRVLP